MKESEYNAKFVTNLIQTFFMKDIWNKFVYKLIECKKNNVEEAIYHNIIEDKLELLGWATYRGEICHKVTLPIGSVGHIQPDILVRRDGENMFVIEVKRPNHNCNERDLQQLFSYMLQLRLKVGIYIGEYLEVFYDCPQDNKEPIPVFRAELALDHKNGMFFAEMFSKENFNPENIKNLYDKIVQEKLNQKKLEELKKKLIANEGELQISNIVKQYLMEAYSTTFSEQDIDKMIFSLSFNVQPKENFNQPVNSIQQRESVERNIVYSQRSPISTRKNMVDNKDHTKYSLNGSEPVGKGRFVLLLVTEYVKSHPTLTFHDLEKVFRPEWHSCGVIKTIDSVDDQRRFYIKNEDRLYDVNHTAFVVCNQWGAGNERIKSYWDKAKNEFFAIANKEGWKVKISN